MHIPMISNLRDACTLTETVRARSFRWRRIGGSALIVCGIAWGAGGQFARRIERRDIDQSSRRQDPAPGFPTPLQVAINNNRVMAMGLFADLDGLAIAYYSVWNTKDYAFTIYRPIHPTEDESTVLDAISKAARAMMPQPGDGVRAVGVGRGEFERGGAVVAAGMLPLEATPRP